MEKSKFFQVAGTATFLACLLYWTGRWYKQWYFNEFHIPQESVEFDQPYYIFHSWCTILVAIGGIAILANCGNVLRAALTRNVAKGLPWLCWFGLSLVLYSGAIWLLVGSPFEGARGSNSLLAVVASKDLVIVGVGIASAIVMEVSLRYIGPRYRRISWFSEATASTTGTALLVLWAYLSVVGYEVGKYHAKSLIARTKMSAPSITIKNEAMDRNWILVVRASENRNFVYAVNGDLSRCVPDSDIVELRAK